MKLPIILYNIPGRTGCQMLPETVVKICKEVPNVVGVKDATGNLAQVATMMSMADGQVDLYSGEDALITPILALGGKGVISVLSIVAPKQVHDICQLYFDGKTEEATKEQLRAVPLINALFSEVNPIPVKKALNLMGKGVGPLRRPLTEMEPEHADKLAKVMKEYGIL